MIIRNFSGDILIEVEAAELWGANLRGANLWGANLRGANLEGANLRGANLEVANLRGANLWGANLEGANLEGANLEGANLRGANLRGANLRGANLEGANLRGANLWGANLEGANLWMVICMYQKFDRVNWSEAEKIARSRLKTLIPPEEFERYENYGQCFVDGAIFGLMEVTMTPKGWFCLDIQSPEPLPPTDRLIHRLLLWRKSKEEFYNIAKKQA